MTSDHIEPLRLFDLAWDDEATDDEKKHLRDCEECKDALEFFTRHAKSKRGFND
jgi:hypothetical protein